MDWSEPRDFREWLRRTISLRSILMILFIFGIMISELRFDWVEQTLGAFLAKTNDKRPESGLIWEISHQAETARRSLEKIITERQTSQREARGANSFIEIASFLSPDQGVMLSPERFRTLFLKLPASIAQEIISPFEILKILNNGLLARTYFEKQENGLLVFFLDSENRVLFQLAITSNQLDLIAQGERSIEGSLEEFSKFNNRIYPSGIFFSALESLPGDVRENVVPMPEILLNLSGQITRIGISDEAVSGNIEIGFEITSGGESRLILLSGREWAVWQLRSLLEGQKLK